MHKDAVIVLELTIARRLLCKLNHLTRRINSLKQTYKLIVLIETASAGRAISVKLHSITTLVEFVVKSPSVDNTSKR